MMTIATQDKVRRAAAVYLFETRRRRALRKAKRGAWLVLALVVVLVVWGVVL